MKELLMYCFPRIAGSSISKFGSVSKTSKVLVAGIIPMGSLVAKNENKSSPSSE
jgi:hypothetical protein